MRVTESEQYSERRDSLDQNWGRFISQALPEVFWTPLPNIGGNIRVTAAELGLDGFILTGGDDIGSSPERDETERAILEWVISEDKAVFGVCRGLQFIQAYAGGPLEPCGKKEHVASRHPVRLSDSSIWGSYAGAELEVNSYHKFGVRETSLSQSLKALASTADGWVEALMHHERCVAVMWHPEREDSARPWDVTLIRKTFGV